MKKSELKQIIREEIKSIIKEVRWSTSVLRKQGYRLGSLITDISKLKKGSIYCLVEMGMGEWQGGYRYDGIVNGKHKFTSVVQGDNSVMTYTEKQFEDQAVDGC